jgi:GTP-binding protein
MLIPPRQLSLDDAIQYLDKGDLLEVTPESLRIRKKILDHNVRQRQLKRAKMDE